MPSQHFNREEAAMLVKRSSEREWTPSGFPGIERSLFRNNDAGGR